jgi:outer membrane receptor protein involved in Fe transport
MSANKNGLLALLAVSALAAPAVAAAQESASEPTSDEIVVTAQKREERIAEVPIAITAITPEAMAGATRLSDLQASVPSLRMVDIGPGSQRISLRGIAQYQGLPTVGNYLNEFSVNPQGASGGAEIPLMDLQRIEVLRGPQGALYGEGAMGGTIRYITARPDLDNFGGSVMAEVATPDGGELGWRAEGVLNAPIDPGRAALRIAVLQADSGGWIDGPNGDDLNGLESNAQRVSLLVEPNNQWSIAVMALHGSRSQDYKSYSFDGHNTTQIVPSLAEQEYNIGTLNISYDAGPFIIESLSGVLEMDNRSVDDSGPFYNELFGGPLLVTAISDSRNRSDRWSQEFRLTSDSAGPLRYIVGVSYSKDEVTSNQVGDAVEDPLFLPFPGCLLGVCFIVSGQNTSEVLAAYANFSYDFSSVLTLDAGGRYARDERSINSRFQIPDFAIDDTSTGSDTFNTFNPRLTLTYHPTEAGIFYASVAKGFRSGGFNDVTGPGVPPTFDPETLWTYELGTKQSFFNGALYMELSAYYNDYRDIQSNAIVPPAFAAVLNSGQASGPGVDFLLRARPSENLSITASIGYNHMRFDTNATDKAEGDPLDLVPDWNGALAIDYTYPLSAGASLDAHLDVGYISDGTITLRQLPQIESSQSRTLANARVTLNLGNLELYGFVDNIGNTERIVNPSFGAFFEPIYTRPRTVGLGVRANF